MSRPSAASTTTSTPCSAREAFSRSWTAATHGVSRPTRVAASSRSAATSAAPAGTPVRRSIDVRSRSSSSGVMVVTAVRTRSGRASASSSAAASTPSAIRAKASGERDLVLGTFTEAPGAK
ncbi:hypothetical protein PH191_04605 [Actinomycetospora callitridis]|nr:hypothetical protein [Actinomycetospora callitridis]MDD7916961.1 hypothetical protein [Actinomycetospora callitridis]